MNQSTCLARCIRYGFLCVFFAITGIGWAEAGPNVLDPNAPELCAGHGELGSISLTGLSAAMILPTPVLLPLPSTLDSADVVSMPGNASICTQKNSNPVIFADGFESNQAE